MLRLEGYYVKVGFCIYEFRILQIIMNIQHAYLPPHLYFHISIIDTLSICILFFNSKVDVVVGVLMHGYVKNVHVVSVNHFAVHLWFTDITLSFSFDDPLTLIQLSFNLFHYMFLYVIYTWTMWHHYKTSRIEKLTHSNVGQVCEKCFPTPWN